MHFSRAQDPSVSCEDLEESGATPNQLSQLGCNAASSSSVNAFERHFGSSGSFGSPSFSGSSRWGFRVIYDMKCSQPRVVTRQDCPLAFNLHRFDSFCHNDVWTRSLRDDQVGEIFSFSDNGYCPNVPICLACPVLGNCRRQPSVRWEPCRYDMCTRENNPSPRWNRCNQFHDGRPYCYIGEQRCRDSQPSQRRRLSGINWSHAACENRGGRVYEKETPSSGTNDGSTTPSP